LSRRVSSFSHLIFSYTPCQAIICTFGVIPTYVILQKFGPKWRKPMTLRKAETMDSLVESL
jgi:hypothetical protein